MGFVETNPQSFNRYAYVNNNPYRFIDPDGRQATTRADYADLLGPDDTGAKIAERAAQIGETAAAVGDAVDDIASDPATYVGGGTLKAATLVGKAVKGTKSTPPIKWGAQEKHFRGHNSYTPGRSTMTSDPTKLAEKAGTGQQVGKVPVGQAGSKERVNFGENIGTYVDQAGNASPTTNGIIHYSKDGIHIVPARP